MRRNKKESGEDWVEGIKKRDNKVKKMKSQKIIDKLNGMRLSLIELRKLHHSKGNALLKSHRDLLERIIDRIYPEKDAKILKKKLVNQSWALTGNETDDYWQNSYINDIDSAIGVIETILEEYSLFGLDNFEPIKEKVETEFQIGSDKVGFWRKKKIK